MLASAPVLAHYDPSLETILQTDASHFGWGLVSQINAETRREHPIAIESGKFTGSQINYSTSEKEFLAIVQAFVRNRHMLLQVATQVVTDHLNLTYWREPRQLSPRQARWEETLAPFRFKITYRPGKQATMPDALSRGADYHPGEGSTVDQEYNFVHALPSYEENRATSPNEADRTTPDALLRALQPLVSILDRDYFVDDNDILQGLHEDNEIAPVRQEMMQIRFTNCQHLTCAPSRLNVPSLNELRRHSRNQQLTSPTWTKRGFLALEGRFYVPNYNDARLKVLRARHDSPLAGHPGISKTIELISRDYTWVGLKKDVEAYVFGCAVCQRTKPSHQRPSGHLRSLEVPTQPWADISMDLSRNYQGRTNITRYSLLSINKRSGRSSYLP